MFIMMAEVPMDSSEVSPTVTPVVTGPFPYAAFLPAEFGGPLWFIPAQEIQVLTPPPIGRIA